MNNIGQQVLEKRRQKYENLRVCLSVNSLKNIVLLHILSRGKKLIIMRILEGLITDGKTGALIRVHAQLYALLAYAQSKTGKKEASEQSLLEAFKIARGFDSTPDYSLSGMRFAEHSDKTMTFDLFGSGTADSIGTIIGLLGDKAMAERWKEINENGK